MKKNVSLRELNENGQLICQFKKVSFIRNGERRPYLYCSNDPTTCYLHYYKNAYYVTQHICSTFQIEYHDFECAQTKFYEVIGCCKDYE